MFIYALLTNAGEVDPSHGFSDVSVTAFVSFEQAATRLYDWYNGQTGADGEIYHSQWREHEDENRWFHPNFPECEIRRIYFYSEQQARFVSNSHSLQQ